jgi:hypothetical protein
VSLLVVIALLADAGVGLIRPDLLEADMKLTGFSAALSIWVAVITLLSAVVYAVPRTAFLGAILITGFLGGAICTHFRIGEIGSPPELICLLLGFATWGGLWLRDERARAILPIG